MYKGARLECTAAVAENIPETTATLTAADTEAQPHPSFARTNCCPSHPGKSQQRGQCIRKMRKRKLKTGGR